MQPSKPKSVSPTARPVVPWNKSAFVGPKPPLKPKQVWSIRFNLQREGRIRDLALFDFAIDSELRGCDLVRLRIGQLVINAAARHRATIVQQKTGKPVQFEHTEQTRDSLIAWLTHRGGRLQQFVLPGRMDSDEHISTRQYARLVGDWVESIGLGRSAYGTQRCDDTPRAPAEVEPTDILQILGARRQRPNAPSERRPLSAVRERNSQQSE